MAPVRNFPTRLAALLLIGAALGGCAADSRASSEKASDPRGEARPVARKHARAAVRSFTVSVVKEDPKAFCASSLPDFRNPGFAAFGVPEGPCVGRAAAMFATLGLRRLESSWAALAEARMGPIELRCASGSRLCAAATVVLEDVPQGGRDTVNALIPAKMVEARWRLGGRRH